MIDKVLQGRCPEPPVDGSTAALGAGAELGRCGGIAERRDRALQPPQQAVQIDRQQQRRRGTGEASGLRAAPAAAEIPAALGGGAQLSVDLRGRAAGLLAGRQHIVAQGFIARQIERVPIAVQQAAVRQPDKMGVCLAGGQAVLAGHPVRMLAKQLRQVTRLLPDGLDHQAEKRGLRAAQKIAAVAVRDMAQRIDQMGEVGDHAFGQIAPAVRQQAQDREVGIPVIDLPKAPAGHHIGVRQRQQAARTLRRIGRIRRTGQLRPQRPDVFADRQQRAGGCSRGCQRRQLEMLADEVAQVEAWHSPALRIQGGERCGAQAARAGIGKALAVAKECLHLHVDEELAKALLRRPDLRVIHLTGGRRRACACPSARNRCTAWRGKFRQTASPTLTRSSSVLASSCVATPGSFR